MARSSVINALPKTNAAQCQNWWWPRSLWRVSSLSYLNHSSSCNWICFLAKSYCLVATAENTEANNLITVLNDSSLTNNARAIHQVISIVDWQLEGNAKDIQLLTADQLTLEGHQVGLKVLLEAAEDDNKNDTQLYQNWQPHPLWISLTWAQKISFSIDDILKTFGIH